MTVLMIAAVADDMKMKMTFFLFVILFTQAASAARVSCLLQSLRCLKMKNRSERKVLPVQCDFFLREPSH